MDLRELGVSGPKSAEFLISKKAIYPEMVGPSYVVLIWTDWMVRKKWMLWFQGSRTYLQSLEWEQIVHYTSIVLWESSPSPNAACMGLREAFFSPAESIPLESSNGRISADTRITYSPGAPIIVPEKCSTQR